MTPGARYGAAIEVIDRIRAGTSAEQALTNWARASRFAGSGDRAAVRDIVFDVLRQWRSTAARGGGEAGRARILGLLRASGVDPATVFTGVGHAPAPLPADLPEAASDAADLPEAVALDCPDWLVAPLRAALGAGFAPVMEALRHRAPVFLRVNLARATLGEAVAALAAGGIVARPHPLAETALAVVENPRKINASAAYLEGLVELQDAASQAVVAALPLAGARAVLDFCAGGGGKALAMAAHPGVAVTAHDADPGRMRDVPARAARAGVQIALAPPGALAAGYDLVLADAPCSGSGAWRRSPEGKWALTPDRLADLVALQDRVLDGAAARVRPGGTLAYATCSMLTVENDARVDAFRARHAGWRDGVRARFTPLDGGDGFFVATLLRD